MNTEHKYQKFFLGILFDIIGYASFILPAVTETVDIVWAPLSAYFMTKLYTGNKGKIAAAIAFFEEITPGLDVLPTFTLMWFYTYVFNDKKKEIKKEL